jgi:nucleoside-diphosphate-sugar epimerase
MNIEQEQDRVRESDRPHLRADIRKIRKETGWKPEISFEAGVEKLIKDRLS